MVKDAEKASMSLCQWVLDLARSHRFRNHGRWILYVILASLVVLWTRAVWAIYSETGLFLWLGTDFALYFAQSTALWAIDPTAIYKLDAINSTYQQLLNAYSPNHPRNDATHVPYPPLFAWLFTPFTMPPPPIGFALWESINVLAAVYLVWRVTQFLSKEKQTSTAIMILTSFPVVFCLMVGQPQLLLACAVAECYLSLRAGRNFRAGLWLACLLVKPHYGLLLGLLLLWKRRWRTVAGAIVGGIVVVTGSILAAGLPTLAAYPIAFTQMAQFRVGDGSELHMINWRSLVLAFRPEIGDLKGMILVQLLALATVLGAGFVWRGPWLPQDRRFPSRFTLVLLATLLANHHSFNYGAAILVVPLAATLVEGQPNRLINLAVVAGVILPTLSFTLVSFLDSPLASRLLLFSLLACYGGLLFQLWREDRQASEVETPGLSMIGGVTHQ